MLRSVFHFSSDYYPLNEGMKNKTKQNKTKQGKKKKDKRKNHQPSDTCCLIKTREPSLNEPIKALKLGATTESEV